MSVKAAIAFAGLVVLCTHDVFFTPAFSQEEDAAEGEDSSQPVERDGPRVRRLGDSLSVDPDAEWVPSFDNSQANSQIGALLEQAEEALSAGNLVSPPESSALFYFQQVLQMEPANPRAGDGVGRVADALVAAARSAASAGDRAQAQSLVDQVKSFRPNYPGLRTLEDQISQREEIEAGLAAAREQLAASDLDAALAGFQAVLGIDSNNAEAQSGIEQIEAAYLSRVEAAIAAGDLEAAAGALDQAAAVRDGSSAVREAEASILAARNQQLADRLAEARDALAAGQLDRAESAISELRGANYEVDTLAAMETEIANIRRLRAYPAGSTFSDDLSSGGVGPVMVVVPEGSFTMGSASRERDRGDNEGPQTSVTFTIPFGLAEGEVTVAQFRAFVDATGYVTDAEQAGQSTIYNVLAGSLKDEAGVSWRQDFQGQGANDEDPVVHVSWNDANAYAEWLANETGENYRLPSEAEFEYALRGGSETRFWWGDGSPRDEVENLTGERDKMAGRWEWPEPFDRYGDDHWGIAPAKSFQPNAFGLYDMGGNALEWVQDCYHSSLDGLDAAGKPYVGGTCGTRVLKGGGWALPPRMSRSASRSSAQPDRVTCLVGFRVAKDL